MRAGGDLSAPACLRTAASMCACGSHGRDAAAGELIGALVHGVTGVPAHPMPMHVVLFERGLKALPEFDVLDRAPVRRAPAIALPGLDPDHDAVAQILAV